MRQPWGKMLVNPGVPEPVPPALPPGEPQRMVEAPGPLHRAGPVNGQVREASRVPEGIKELIGEPPRPERTAAVQDDDIPF